MTSSVKFCRMLVQSTLHVHFVRYGNGEIKFVNKNWFYFELILSAKYFLVSFACFLHHFTS